MSNRVSKSNPLQVLFALVALALIISLPSPLHAQTFQTVPALAFTKAFAQAEPLPQVLTIAYTDQSTVRFSTAATTNTGGAWLSVSPAGNACCYTPLAVSAIVTAGNLAAGTYTGQIVITNYSNAAIKMTIPVTLTVAASGATFFDDLPGKLSFSFKTNGSATSQSIQIRNSGAGTLNWTLAASTADGGGWLSASASSGAAPSTITIGINKSSLPEEARPPAPSWANCYSRHQGTASPFRSPSPSVPPCLPRSIRSTSPWRSEALILSLRSSTSP